MINIRQSMCASGLWLIACAARGEDVITLTSGEWPPYISQQAPEYGVISRIVTAAFAQEGVRVNYLFRPWSRAYAEAANGGANGSIIWSTSTRGTQRTRDFYASEVVFEGRSVFFHRKNYAFRWQGEAQLPGLRIGGTAGYEYRFEKYPGVKIDRTAASDERNFQKLVAGRFDLLPVNLDVGLEIMRRHLTPEQAAQLTWDPHPYNVTGYHLLLNKKNPDHRRYLERFNRGLKKLRESGGYAQYLQSATTGAGVKMKKAAGL
jgi:polar amino acid transport system substrate-binding protein